MKQDLQHHSSFVDLGCKPVGTFANHTGTMPGVAIRIPVDLHRLPPEILLNPELPWRGACLRQVAHIPSGYTYLAQLMGHDMGKSVPIESVPHVLSEPLNAGRNLMPAVIGQRYNLIENPLTLETVYGAGPTLLMHLYDPQTMLFRLPQRAELAHLHGPAQGAFIRALYDERNRDSLMLHEMTVAIMQYHNLCARRLLNTDVPAFAAYSGARAHVVAVWHAILRNDLLPRFLHPDIAALDESELASAWHLDETTLLIGLFRSFHALPLSAYQFATSGPHNLDRLLKQGYGPSDAETFWRVGWDQFLGAAAGGPRTGISLSVAREMRMIAALDFASSDEANPLQLSNDAIGSMINELPGNWPQTLTPLQLAADFARIHPQAPRLPTADTLSKGPLYQVLMVEAQCHGVKGGFGPLGSALLRASVEGSIRRVRNSVEPEMLATQPRPATMLELINLVRSLSK